MGLKISGDAFPLGLFKRSNKYFLVLKGFGF